MGPRPQRRARPARAGAQRPGPRAWGQRVSREPCTGRRPDRCTCEHGRMSTGGTVCVRVWGAQPGETRRGHRGRHGPACCTGATRPRPLDLSTTVTGACVVGGAGCRMELGPQLFQLSGQPMWRARWRNASERSEGPGNAHRAAGGPRERSERGGGGSGRLARDCGTHLSREARKPKRMDRHVSAEAVAAPAGRGL